jgi:polysaccharide biosynthesis transport protein
MVTSAQPGEGESTTVANLAIAFAHTDIRATLTDLDFRNTYLESLVGLEGGPGLPDVVAGRTSLDEALVKSPSPQGEQLPTVFQAIPEAPFWILPSGTASNPADFAATGLLSESLETLAQRADIVLVDAPWKGEGVAIMPR